MCWLRADPDGAVDSAAVAALFVRGCGCVDRRGDVAVVPWLAGDGGSSLGILAVVVGSRGGGGRGCDCGCRCGKDGDAASSAQRCEVLWSVFGVWGLGVFSAVSTAGFCSSAAAASVAEESSCSGCGCGDVCARASAESDPDAADAGLGVGSLCAVSAVQESLHAGSGAYSTGDLRGDYGPGSLGPQYAGWAGVCDVSRTPSFLRQAAIAARVTIRRLRRYG